MPPPPCTVFCILFLWKCSAARKLTMAVQMRLLPRYDLIVVRHGSVHFEAHRYQIYRNTNIIFFSFPLTNWPWTASTDAARRPVMKQSVFNYFVDNILKKKKKKKKKSIFHNYYIVWWVINCLITFQLIISSFLLTCVLLSDKARVIVWFETRVSDSRFIIGRLFCIFFLITKHASIIMIGFSFSSRSYC